MSTHTLHGSRKCGMYLWFILSVKNNYVYIVVKLSQELHQVDESIIDKGEKNVQF